MAICRKVNLPLTVGHHLGRAFEIGPVEYAAAYIERRARDLAVRLDTRRRKNFRVVRALLRVVLRRRRRALPASVNEES
jgi:hypothetical protein